MKIFFVTIFIITLLFNSGCQAKEKTARFTSQPVMYGSFRKVVEAKGVIRPMTEETVSIPNDVWGTLEKLVPEGTKVKKGDFVARVNVREMLENYNNYSEKLANTKVDSEKQKAELPVEMLKADKELDQKKNDLTTKSLDYKLIKRGPAEDIKTKADIDMDIPQIKLNNHPLGKKRELFKKGYLSEQEVNSSELEFQGLDSDYKKAKISKYQLTPGYQKNIFDKAKLLEDQAKLDVKINGIENKAFKSSLQIKARNSEFRVKHYFTRLKKFKKSIQMADIYAPASGIVIYPLIWGWRKPFVGMEVWDGFSFMTIAGAEQLKIETKINEQEIINVKTGQVVEIRIASFPGQVFRGKVRKIGKLAKYLDERNPEGLKFFDVDIAITERLNQLKTNMNVDLKIINTEQNKSYYIPAEALIEEGKNSFVYFEEKNKPVKKEVKVKERNNDYVLLADKLTGTEKFYIMPATNKI